MTALSELTTIQVGGEPERLVEATTREALAAAALEAWGSPEDWLILGGGSNLVVADEGVPGTVVRVATRGIERIGGAAPGFARIRVEAGEPWDEVVRFAVEHRLAGVEALSGIPGTAGAAPVQNVGAYGQELAETLVAVELLDFATGGIERLNAADLGLGYRTSALRRGRLGVVLAVELDLVEAADGSGAAIRYDQLARALGVELGARVPLDATRAAVLGLRASKGMLLDPADPDSVSAGSFFTNPIVTEHFARGLPAEAPHWPTEPEEPPRVLPLGAPIPAAPASGEYLVKLSAAWLIERAGIARGFALPGSRAAISSKHTLAITNRGGATAGEVVQLAGFVRTRVLSEFGVALQPEPILVGLDLDL